MGMMDATNTGRFSCFLFKNNAFPTILHPSSFVLIAFWLQLCILFHAPFYESTCSLNELDEKLNHTKISKF
jgi:hypothetical protein